MTLQNPSNWFHEKTRVRSLVVQIVIDTREIYKFRLIKKISNSD